LRTAHPLARRRARDAWLLLIPALAALAAVALWPLLRTIAFSFTDAQLLSLQDRAYAGFENFLWLVEDPDWWRSVRNTLVFTFASVALETVLGFVIALALHAHFAGRGPLRAAVLIPWAIPTVVSAKMWAWMFHDVFGVVNALLLHLGLIAEPVAWTASPGLAMIVLVAVDVWKTTPFMALLLLAGLQMLPQDCYEQARLDGVHPLRVFLRVTMPLMKPALAVAVIFRALDALRIFDLVYVLTGNNRETMTMSVYARQQLVEFQDVGLGSAASTLLFLTIALVTIVTIMGFRLRLAEPARTAA